MNGAIFRIKTGQLWNVIRVSKDLEVTLANQLLQFTKHAKWFVSCHQQVGMRLHIDDPASILSTRRGIFGGLFFLSHTQNSFELCTQFSWTLGLWLIPVLHIRQHAAQTVDRLQEQVNVAGLHRTFPGPYFVQQCFDDVSKFRNRHKAEGSRAPLDRVRRPENVVDGFVINVGRVHIKEFTFHDIQAFEAFLEKDLMELRQIDTHSLILKRV